MTPKEHKRLLKSIDLSLGVIIIEIGIVIGLIAVK